MLAQEAKIASIDWLKVLLLLSPIVSVCMVWCWLTFRERFCGSAPDNVNDSVPLHDELQSNGELPYVHVGGGDDGFLSQSFLPRLSMLKDDEIHS